MNITTKLWEIKGSSGLYSVTHRGWKRTTFITSGKPNADSIARMSESKLNKICLVALDTGIWQE